MARQRNVYNQAQRSNSSGLGGVYATFMEYPRAEVIASDIPQLLALKAEANAPEEVDGASISELNSFIKNQEFDPVGSDIPTSAQMQWNQEINKLNAESASHKNITLSKNVNTPLNSLAQSLDNDNYYGKIEMFANNDSKIKASEARLQNIWEPYRDAIQDEAYSKDIAWDGYQPIRTGDIAKLYGINDNRKNSMYLNSQLYSFQDNNYNVFKHNPNIIQRPVKLDYDSYNSLLTKTFQDVKPDQLTFVYDAMSKASVDDVIDGQATTSSDKQKITTGVSLGAINALHNIINSDEDEAVKNQEIARILQINSDQVSKHMAAIEAVTLFQESVQNDPELRSVHLRQQFGFYDNVFRNGKYKDPNDPKTEVEIDPWFLDNKNVLPEDLMYGRVNYDGIDDTDEKVRLEKLEKKYKDDIESALHSTYMRRMRAYNPSDMTYEFNDLIDVRPATDSEIVTSYLKNIYSPESTGYESGIYGYSSSLEFELSNLANPDAIRMLHDIVPDSNTIYHNAITAARDKYENMDIVLQEMANETINELRPYLALLNPDKENFTNQQIHNSILNSSYQALSDYEKMYRDIFESKVLLETVDISNMSEQLMDLAKNNPKEFKNWTEYDILREVPNIHTRRIWLDDFEKNKQNIDGYEVYKTPASVYIRKDDKYYVYKKRDFKRIEESFSQTGTIALSSKWFIPPDKVKKALQFEGRSINRDAVIMFAGSPIKVPHINNQGTSNATITKFNEVEAITPIYPFMVEGEMVRTMGIKTTIVIDEDNFKKIEGLPFYDGRSSSLKHVKGSEVYKKDDEYLKDAGIVKQQLDDGKYAYILPIVVTPNVLESALLNEGNNIILQDMIKFLESSQYENNEVEIE